MKNASKYVLIMTLVLLFLSIAIPALAEGSKPPTTPTSGIDDWDDDVWADWGAPPSNPKSNAQPALPNEDVPADASASLPGALPPPPGGDGFGAGKSQVRFTLVREGLNDQPRGVRKFRPSYGNSRRKSL